MEVNMPDSKVVAIIDRWDGTVLLNEKEVDELFEKLDEKYFHLDVKKQLFLKKVYEITSSNSLDTIP